MAKRKNQYQAMMTKAADLAKERYVGTVKRGSYEVTVTKCFRDGYPYFRQAWKFLGVKIKTADVRRCIDY